MLSSNHIFWILIIYFAFQEYNNYRVGFLYTRLPVFNYNLTSITERILASLRRLLFLWIGFIISICNCLKDLIKNVICYMYLYYLLSLFLRFCSVSFFLKIWVYLISADIFCSLWFTEQLEMTWTHTCINTFMSIKNSFIIMPNKILYTFPVTWMISLVKYLTTTLKNYTGW